MVCQRTRGILEKATKLDSERPVRGDSAREGAHRALMKMKEEETGLQGARTYRVWP